MNYKTFVNEFSDKGYMLLAKPMVDAAMKMVKSVAGERRDIPYMRQASIDHIIKSGTCICGTKIRPGNLLLPLSSAPGKCFWDQKGHYPQEHFFLPEIQ